MIWSSDFRVCANKSGGLPKTGDPRVLCNNHSWYIARFYPEANFLIKKLSRSSFKIEPCDPGVSHFTIVKELVIPSMEEFEVIYSHL